MPTAVEFIWFENIEGETTHAGSKGWIEVMSFSWGVSQPGANGFGSGAGAGRVSFQDFSFTSPATKASPQLFQACVTGKHIANVKLFAANPQGLDFYKIMLSDVLVSGFSDSAAQGNLISGNLIGTDGFPMSKITLNFSKISYQTMAVNGDGSPPAIANFDLGFGLNQGR